MSLRTGPKHHSCSKGRRVRVVLRDGTTHDTRFVEKNDRRCVTEAGSFPWANVDKFFILKPRPTP